MFPDFWGKLAVVGPMVVTIRFSTTKTVHIDVIKSFRTGNLASDMPKTVCIILSLALGSLRTY